MFEKKILKVAKERIQIDLAQNELPKVFIISSVSAHKTEIHFLHFLIVIELLTEHLYFMVLIAACHSF